MKLSKTPLLVSAASFLFAAAVGSGACSSDATSPITVATPIPAGVTFSGGYVAGGNCTGDVYIAATTGTGFLVCTAQGWSYETAVPTGYTLYSGETTISITPDVPIPAGVVFPDGFVVGGACTGDVYIDATVGAGFLVCDDGEWTYDTTIPSGYTVFTGSGFGDDSGDDSGFGDDTSDDASDDSGFGDDTSDDASDDSGDDASDDSGDDASDDSGDDASDDSGEDAGDDSGS